MFRLLGCQTLTCVTPACRPPHTCPARANRRTTPCGHCHRRSKTRPHAGVIVGHLWHTRRFLREFQPGFRARLWASPLAFAVHLEDVNMVSDAIEQHAGQTLGPQGSVHSSNGRLLVLRVAQQCAITSSARESVSCCFSMAGKARRFTPTVDGTAFCICVSSASGICWERFNLRPIAPHPRRTLPDGP